MVFIQFTQIPPGVEEKEIIQIFSECGEVLEFRFIRDKANLTFKGAFSQLLSFAVHGG
jgi:RNA recognition motif-containing protein